MEDRAGEGKGRKNIPWVLPPRGHVPSQALTPSRFQLEPRGAGGQQLGGADAQVIRAPMGQLRRQVAPRRPEGAGRVRHGTNRSLALAQTLSRNLSRATPSGFLPPCFHTSACPHFWFTLMSDSQCPPPPCALARGLPCIPPLSAEFPPYGTVPPLSFSACWCLRVTSCPSLPGIEGVPCT